MTDGGSSDVAYRRPDDVAHVVDVASGCCVLLHLPTGRRVSLSATASAVWRAVVESGDAGATTVDLAAALAAEFRADPAQVTTDVRALLDQLVTEGLVQPTP